MYVIKQIVEQEEFNGDRRDQGKYNLCKNFFFHI